MIRRPPRSTLFPYTDALPISPLLSASCLRGLRAERTSLSELELMSSPRNAMIGSTITSLASRSEEHTSELQSRQYLVCRLLLEKKNKISHTFQPLLLIILYRR